MGFLKSLEKPVDKGLQAEHTDMTSRVGLSKKLPYLVVQEGIWKNQATERVREFLVSKFSDRAEIELRYIRLLQDWLDELDPPRDQNDAASYVDSLVVKSVLDCLKKEAAAHISARQKVYNSIMNDLGPSSAIRREVVSNNQSLSWVRDQFDVIKYEDRKGEKDHRIHTEKKEHISNQIEALDSQLVNRSRITSARRSRHGGKKVDALRQRVSFLRKQLLEEEEMVVAAQRELMNLETKACGELGKMENVLKDLEKIRIQNITQQTRLFIQSMLNHQTQSARSASIGETLRQCLKDVAETEKYLDQHWDDVEAHALRAQTGQTFKLRQLFEVPPKRPKSADSRKSVDSLRIAEIEANRLIELDGKPKFTASPVSKQFLQSKASSQSIPEEAPERKQQRTKTHEETPKKSPTTASRRKTIDISMKTPEKSPKPGIRTETTDNRRRTPNKSPRTDDRNETTDNRRETPRETMIRFSPDSDSEIEIESGTSETSIEEIRLPPETRYGKRTTPRPQAAQNGWIKSPKPEPNRPKKYDDEVVDDDDWESDHRSLESQRVFSRGSEAQHGKRRNCKVVAIADYTASGPGELTLKKGQLIKQKAGEDHRGLCYGWTREHLLFPKKYGFYPKEVVCLDGFQ